MDTCGPDDPDYADSLEKVVFKKIILSLDIIQNVV